MDSDDDDDDAFDTPTGPLGATSPANSAPGLAATANDIPDGSYDPHNHRPPLPTPQTDAGMAPELCRLAIADAIQHLLAPIPSPTPDGTTFR